MWKAKSGIYAPRWPPELRQANHELTRINTNKNYQKPRITQMGHWTSSFLRHLSFGIRHFPIIRVTVSFVVRR